MPSLSDWGVSSEAGPGNDLRGGCVRGTVEDAGAFLTVVLSACERDGALESALCRTFEPQRGNADWPYEMGLGWIRSERSAATVLWHNGGTAGAATFLGFSPENGVGLAILTNVSGLREIDALGLSFLGGESR